MKIACDHGGFNLAKKLSNHYNADYIGPTNLDSKDDYPLFAQKMCEQLNDNIGVLICRTGQGMCIAANRYKHVRAVLVKTISDAKTTRQHNHANVICLAADTTDFNTAVKLVDTFINTEFDLSPRHCRRVNQL